MDQRSWVKDQGSWTLDLASCSGMNDHPGRDADVISRPSVSFYIRFYIRFTKIGSRIQDIAPCFGMNGHSRRDSDVRLRLSTSTIEDLRCDIGLISHCRVKTIVYDETMTLLWMLDRVWHERAS